MTWDYTPGVGEGFKRTPTEGATVVYEPGEEMLIDLSSFISVPEAPVLERRVGPTHEAEAGAEGPIRPLIRVGSSAERPGEAFAAVPYRGHWFAIDDLDIPSKPVFMFLMFIFTLVETGGKEGAPVLTIPTQ